MARAGTSEFDRQKNQMLERVGNAYGNPKNNPLIALKATGTPWSACVESQLKEASGL